MPTNKLNNLDSKTWLKFQKSWFIHNPPPRKKGVLVHPAKFPETMAQEFIEFFTKQGETVLDPMAGTGSTLIAALRSGRNSYGIELNPKYAEIAQQTLGPAIRGVRQNLKTWDRRIPPGFRLWQLAVVGHDKLRQLDHPFARRRRVLRIRHGANGKERARNEPSELFHESMRRAPTLKVAETKSAF